MSGRGDVHIAEVQCADVVLDLARRVLELFRPELLLRRSASFSLDELEPLLTLRRHHSFEQAEPLQQ